MQRRGGRGSAYISPPIQRSPHMGSDDLNKASARLSHRNYRVWLIVFIVLLILTFTHYFLPSTTSTQNQATYSNANLKPKNYLNASVDVANPFDFCPIYGPGDELAVKYGAPALSKTRLHLGSGVRVQRVLNKALAGQPVTISVIGGSVSACHGAGDDPISPKCYPSRFFQWWNTIFPHPASELTNGAMRRTSSGYFGYCNAHHIPDNTDLVIIDLDSEDQPDKETAEHFEVLIRSILLRIDNPAILLLGTFSPQIHATHGFAGPDHTHNAIAQFYDVPHVSTKPLLFPEYMRNPSSVQSTYFVDPVLPSPRGHEVITDVLVSYIQAQVCTAWAVAHGSSFDAVPEHMADGPSADADSPGLFGGMGQRKGVPELGMEDSDPKIKQGAAAAAAAAKDKLHLQLHVPQGRIATRPNDGRPFEEVTPYCVSANDLINPLPPSLFYGSGWHAFHPTASGGGNTLSTSSHYWYSTLPTSRIRIPLQIGAGDVGVYYLREPVASVKEGSSVECWVDDNYAGAKVLENAADVGEPTPTLQMIDHYVSRGSHFVECQLMGEEGVGVPAFKMLGIFAT